MKISISKKAWMAGFMDGEGTFSIIRQNRNPPCSPIYSVLISVGNTDIRPLNIFANYYGGRLHFRSNQKNHGGKWADVYSWRCPTNTAYRFLKDIKQFLVVKQEQACVVLQFLEDMVSRNGKRRGVTLQGGSGFISSEELTRRECLYDKIKILNKKGPHKYDHE